MKSLTNCEIPFSNPLQRVCSDLLIAACVSKSCSEPKKLFREPAITVHKRKSTNENEGKPEQKFDAAFGTNFRINKCFQISKQKLHNTFSLELGKLKI
jgi:hypothetical protein